MIGFGKMQKKWRLLLHERVLWRLQDLSEGWRASSSTRTVFTVAVYTLIVIYVALCSFFVLAYGTRWLEILPADCRVIRPVFQH